MPQVMQSANDETVDVEQKDGFEADDKTVDVEQKDASEVENVGDKTSSGEISDDNQKGPIVKFVSADGKFFYVEEKVSRKFKFAGEITNENGGGQTRTLKEIDSNILTIMIKWAEHHVDDPETSSDTKTEEGDYRVRRTDDINEWDKELLNLKTDTLFLLIEAARITQMEGLFSVSCKKFASMIKGKSPEALCEILNIPKPKKEKVLKKCGKFYTLE